jgi:hypothetical protein
MKIKITYLTLLLFISNVYSQNLLNTASWTVGTGNVADFSMYGTTQNNDRELGSNHIGQEVILWKAIPDNLNTVDGGFTSSFKSIDNTKTYRFTVWVKKINSQSGTTYVGCNSYASGQHQTLNLDGTTNTNPYWNGDLPELNKWYLLVGYIHNSNYTSNINLGRIYDGTTGEEVLTISDLKFSSIAYSLRLRAFLYNATDLNVRQYLYNPTIEQVNGNEATLNELLSINQASKLLFSFDNSGSQKQRFYCSISTCPVPTPPIGRSSDDNLDNLIAENAQKDDLNSANLDKNNLVLYPNPTAGRISISLSNVDYHLSDLISIYSINGSLVKEVNLKEKTKSSELDISNQPSGVYFIHIHLSNGGVVTRRIIKQ